MILKRFIARRKIVTVTIIGTKIIVGGKMKMNAIFASQKSQHVTYVPVLNPANLNVGITYQIAIFAHRKCHPARPILYLKIVVDKTCDTF